MLAVLQQPQGPTLLGFDVVLVGTILAGVAALAVMFAIYTALTIKDP
ncbi:MAG: type II secretion system F family protein, partial [Erythrobacter sp.]|nr:type II secretion system F family protein [Erythrobacter sp.]